MPLHPLPIDDLVPEALALLQRERALVLRAEPGAGKTTRLPPALAWSPWLSGGVLVVQPRRIAARLAARFVADERQVTLGREVGYQVRFEDRTSAQTRLCYATDGLVLRRLLEDADLRGLGAVILDEFHERRLDTELVFTLLLELRKRRPELALVVMSATLDPEPLQRLMGGCPHLDVPGRSFPLTIDYDPEGDELPLARRVRSGLRRVEERCPKGDVLVFLPGLGEIRQTAELLQPMLEGAGWTLSQLHGDMPLDDQVAAVTPGVGRKVVLSTNVAESSITVEGVTAVIDSGLARVARVDPYTGTPQLVLEEISQASAIQRAGRAGRTGPGHVLRLYGPGAFERRRGFDRPEIERLDLAQAVLMLRGCLDEDPRRLTWLSPPPEPALAAAERLLRSLDALTPEGRLTAIGRAMLALPLPPRLGRVFLECRAAERTADGARLCALLQEKELRLALRGPAVQRAQHLAHQQSGDSDLTELLDTLLEAEEAGLRASALRRLGLDEVAARGALRTTQQLERAARSLPNTGLPSHGAPREEALARALLHGFPDRVARRRNPGSEDLVLASGESATLAKTSVVTGAELLLAVDLESRQEGRRSFRIVRLACALRPEWLLDELSDSLQSLEEYQFERASRVVLRTSKLCIGSVTLEQSTQRARPGPEVSALLSRAALEPGMLPHGLMERLETLRCRCALLAEHCPELSVARLDEELLTLALDEAFSAVSGFDQLDEEGLMTTLEQAVASHGLLARHAPLHVTLGGGRRVAVHYEPNTRPWIASRLQDFFGTDTVPSVASGRVPLTLHLLAPNQRAVQVTTDLAGFWERHYPAIRRELMRRYPRHSWPEDGRTAEPPAPKPRRA